MSQDKHRARVLDTNEGFLVQIAIGDATRFTDYGSPVVRKEDAEDAAKRWLDSKRPRKRATVVWEGEV